MTTARADNSMQGTVSVGGAPGLYYFDGDIGENTWKDFEKNAADVELVILNSRGGYVVPAKKIAALIRKNKIDTVVMNNAVCFSACVLLFQAGITRTAQEYSTFMLHPVSVTIGGNILVKDVIGTIEFRHLLVTYGMDISGLSRFDKDGDTYFIANDALLYKIATK